MEETLLTPMCKSLTSHTSSLSPHVNSRSSVSCKESNQTHLTFYWSCCCGQHYSPHSGGRTKKTTGVSLLYKDIISLLEGLASA